MKDQYGQDPTMTYTLFCAKLKKQVTLGYYQTHCECGDEIIGVPRQEEEKLQ